MNRYRVLFFYETDLRLDWEGEALNDIGALTKATETLHINNPSEGWAQEDGFRVEIRFVSNIKTTVSS